MKRLLTQRRQASVEAAHILRYEDELRNRHRALPAASPFPSLRMRGCIAASSPL